MTGQTIAHFEVLSKLGSDSTGDYFKATERVLGQEVLVRVLRSEFGRDEAAYNRFLREAKAAAGLNHPNISAILEIGRGPSGPVLTDERIFIVTPLREQRFGVGVVDLAGGSVAKAVEIARQVAEALSAAHEFGLLHGCLREECVVSTESGQIVVGDFGMRHLLEGSTSETATRQTDLLLLGALLYRMIAGKPFEPGSSKPPKLEGVSPELAEIVDHLLEPDAARRPTSARTVIDALNEVPEAAEASSRAVYVLPQSRGWSRILLGSVLAAAAATAALWFALRPDPVPEAERVLAVAPFQVDPADNLDYLSGGLAEGLSLAFDSVGGWRTVNADASVGMAAIVNLAAEPDRTAEFASRLKAGRVVSGSIDRDENALIIRTAIWKSDGDLAKEITLKIHPDTDAVDALTVLVDRLASAMGVDGEVSVRRFLSESDEAVEDYFVGMDALRSGRLDEAVSHFKSAVDADPGFALAWSALSRAAQLQDNRVDFERATAEAMERSDRLPPSIRTLTGARDLAFRKGRPEEARRSYARLLAGDSTNAVAWAEMGDTYLRYNPHLGLSESQAAPYYHRALTYLPEQRMILQRLYSIALDQGREAEADSLAAIMDTTAGEDPVNTFISLATSAEDMDKAEAFIVAADEAGRMDAYLPGSAEYLRSLIAAAEGRFQDHDRLTWDAGEDYSGTRLVSQVMLSAHGSYPATRAQLDELRTRIAQWDTAAHPVMMLDRVDVFANRYNILKPFLLALVELRAENRQAFEQSLDELSSLAASEPGAQLAASLENTVRAVEAYRRDDFASALDYLERAKLNVSWSDMSRSQIYDQSLNRYVRSVALFQIGRTSESRRVARSLTASGYIWGLTYLGPMRLQEARTFALEGNINGAIRAYDRFLSLWSDCDPSLVQVREAARAEKRELED